MFREVIWGGFLFLYLEMRFELFRFWNSFSLKGNVVRLVFRFAVGAELGIREMSGVEEFVEFFIAGVRFVV